MKSLSRPHLLLSTLLLVSACGRAPGAFNDGSEGTSEEGENSSSPETGPQPTTTGPPATTSDPTSGPSTTNSDPDTSTGEPECYPVVSDIYEVEGATASVDIAFDAQGNLVGTDTFALFRSSYGQASQLWVPGLVARAGLRYLPDGRLVFIEENQGRALIINPDATIDVLTADLVYPFGLAVDQDGLVYIADDIRIIRIDPETGFQQNWFYNVPGGARWLTFDRDYQSLYVGGYSNLIYKIGIGADGQVETFSEFGSLPVWMADSDSDDGEIAEGSDSGGEAATSYDSGDSSASATTDTNGDGDGDGDGGWGEFEALIDGLGVDECGNVYAADYFTSALYWIPQWGGQGELLIDWGDVQYGHGFEWGSGIGGWSPTSLYMPQPYNNNRVVEVEIGVMSKERVYPN